MDSNNDGKVVPVTVWTAWSALLGVALGGCLHGAPAHGAGERRGHAREERREPSSAMPRTDARSPRGGSLP